MLMLVEKAALTTPKVTCDFISVLVTRQLFSITFKQALAAALIALVMVVSTLAKITRKVNKFVLNVLIIYCCKYLHCDLLLGPNNNDDDIYCDKDSQECAQLFFAEEVAVTGTDRRAIENNRDEQPVPTTSKALESISNEQRSFSKSLVHQSHLSNIFIYLISLRIGETCSYRLNAVTATEIFRSSVA